MVQLHSRVGPDGVLKLAVPLGAQDANADVVVTIQTVAAQSVVSAKQPWLAFLDDTYGSCADLGVERGVQGQYESREVLD